MLPPRALLSSSITCAIAFTLSVLFLSQSSSSLSSVPPRMQMGEKGTTNVIFICLGNICRSPTAEAVFKHKVALAGKEKDFFIDSCGTGGGNSGWYRKGGWSYHEGDAADSRMTAAASKRNICLTSRSRPLTERDVDTFDHLVCMDKANKAAVLEAARHWGVEEKAAGKLRMIMDYGTKSKLDYVPDPYYGGSDGFDKVLDLLEDACQGFLDHITSP